MTCSTLFLHHGLGQVFHLSKALTWTWTRTLLRSIRHVFHLTYVVKDLPVSENPFRRKFPWLVPAITGQFPKLPWSAIAN